MRIHLILQYLAHETILTEQTQSGWLSLVTPVKGSVMVYDMQGNVPWWYIQLDDDHWLDLSIVVLHAVVLVLLIIVLPVLAREKWGVKSKLAGISIVSGVVLGLSISYYGFYSYGTMLVSANYFLVTMGLFVAALIWSIYASWAEKQLGV